jgi:hypothetical protein
MIARIGSGSVHWADSAVVYVKDSAGHGLVFSRNPNLDNGQSKACRHLFWQYGSWQKGHLACWVAGYGRSTSLGQFSVVF